MNKFLEIAKNEQIEIANSNVLNNENRSVEKVEENFMDKDLIDEILIIYPKPEHIQQVINALKIKIKSNCQKEFWDKFFVKTLNYIFRVLADSNKTNSTVILCIDYLIDLVQAQYQRIIPIMDTFLHNVLGCYQFNPKIWDIVDELFKWIIKFSTPLEMLKILISKMPKEDTPILQNVIKQMTYCLKTLQENQKEEAYQLLSQNSTQIMNFSSHEKSEVKRAIILFLAQAKLNFEENFDNIFTI